MDTVDQTIYLKMTDKISWNVDAYLGVGAAQNIRGIHVEQTVFVM